MAERILVIKCSSDCKYLRVAQDPFEDKANRYCAYNPHSSWDEITPETCESCHRPGRFVGIPIEEAIARVERALKDAVMDDEVATDHHLAVVAINSLVGIKE